MLSNQLARRCVGPAILALGGACYALLQPGVFPHDVGDNQVAAITLGIQHCPGYPLLTLLGHPFTHLFPRDPAYGVTIMNWLAGMVVLWLTYSCARCWRVRPALAVSAVLVLGAWPRFWIMWMAPDVHVPFLLWLVGFVLCYSRWALRGGSAALCGAMLLMGCILATRNSTILYVPFLLVGTYLVARRQASLRQARIPAARAAACLLLPMVVAGGFLWLRDRPATLHNYIQQRIESAPTPPRPKLDPPPDTWGRLSWLVRADQYWAKMKTQPAQILAQAWRFAVETYVSGAMLLTLAWLTGIVALVRLWRRGAAGLGVILLGILLSDGVFLCTYRVWDVADMTLPMVWIQIFLATLGTEQLVRSVRADLRRRRATGRARDLQSLPAVILVVMVVVCGIRAAQTVHAGPDQLTVQDVCDAVKWRELPRPSTVVVEWAMYPAISYGRVLHRPDVRVLAADSIIVAAKRWSAEGAVYFVHHSTNTPPEWTIRKEYGLWRVIPDTGGTADTQPATPP